jgi:hypothetical protein
MAPFKPSLNDQSTGLGGSHVVHGQRCPEISRLVPIGYWPLIRLFNKKAKIQPRTYTMPIKITLGETDVKKNFKLAIDVAIQGRDYGAR